MAKISRNGPCPCGSGSKTKRCCSAIPETAAVYRLPPGLWKEAVLDLMGIDRAELRSFLEQLRYLPEVDPTFPTCPDSIDGRCDLAQAVLTLREQGSIPPKIAAAAVIELVGEESTLFSPRYPNRLGSWLAAVALLPG
jgi:hypothetical protein